MTLQVCIMTPDRIFFDQLTEEIILPTNTGQMGVLTNHAPLITALDIGVMLIREQKEWSGVAIMGGFALIKQNQVTVLVNEAESKDTINPQEAEDSVRQAIGPRILFFINAKQKLEQAIGQKQKVEANFAFKRARARYQVISEV
uniref:ATP synthase epsilon chain, chloroplastic n=1 Tax=Batophora oerstedii TaxID=3140 RepID=A0A386JLV3_BATOE|nr:ATP synthase CF1 epsilon subunit [Batophora oerstedii]